MKKLHISQELSLPIDSVTQTFAVLAKRRVGKTYTASVIAEEFAKAKQPFVALDPTGAWWGLRSSSDGTKDGFPVTIIGGAHGDIPLESTAGKIIAELVVDHPGFYILDTSLFESGNAQDRFAEDFATRLYYRKEKSRDPLHLFVDEADMFAPQKPFPNQTKMLGAFEALVRRGGIRGIGVTLITQRPAVLNKNVLTQTECLIILQMPAPQDQDAIEDWIRRNGTKKQKETLMSSLASLGKGEAWVWSPAWLDVFKKVHIRERETFNSSATPKVGEKVIEPQQLAPVDLEKLKDKIANTIEQVKANDPNELKKQISQLKRELQTRPTEPKIEQRIVEKPVLNGQLAELQQALGTMKQLGSDLAGISQLILKASNDIITAINKFQKTPTVFVQSKPRAVAPIVQKQEGLALKAGETKMLQTLASRHPTKLTRSQLGTLSGYTPSAGTFANYFGTLKRNGFISESSNGDIEITQQGFNELGSNVPPQPQTSEELIALWRQALGAGERKMLDVLISAYPNFITREQLGMEAGYTHTAGTFGNYLGTLRRNGLIDQQGDSVRASESLFI